MDLTLLWVFCPLMLRPVQRGASGALALTVWWTEQRAARRAAWTTRIRWGTGLICLTLLTVLFSLGIAVLPEEGMEVWMASLVPARWRQADPHRAGKAIFVLTVWLFETPGAPFHRNLWLQEKVLVAGEPSAKVIAALHSEDETKRAQGLEEISGLTLTNRDLRSANLRDTLFAAGDLRGANLQGANLVGARFFAVNLSSFSISKGGRCVDEAQQSEDRRSCRTNLQGADLAYAQLQGATLAYAQLPGRQLGGRFRGRPTAGRQLSAGHDRKCGLHWGRSHVEQSTVPFVVAIG